MGALDRDAAEDRDRPLAASATERSVVERSAIVATASMLSRSRRASQPQPRTVHANSAGIDSSVASASAAIPTTVSAGSNSSSTVVPANSRSAAASPRLRVREPSRCPGSPPSR